MADSFPVGRYRVPTSPWISPLVIVKVSAGRGMGLFATQFLGTGETVLRWGGDSYTDRAGANAARLEGKGVMQWDDDLFSCEGGTDHDAFAINHSCDPNVWLKGVFTLTARRDIYPGEELAIDYATLGGDDDSSADWTCLCAAPACRGRVTGADWKLEILQIRYAGHFTPWLSHRIATDQR